MFKLLKVKMADWSKASKVVSQTVVSAADMASKNKKKKLQQ